MNKIKKTLLMASIMALSTEAVFNINSEKVFAAEAADTQTVETAAINGQAASEPSENTMTEEEKAILRINEGNETLSDYSRLRAKNVKKDNLVIVKNAIKAAKEAKHANLDKTEIKNTVANIISQIKTSTTNINKGIATVDNYKTLMIDKVNDSNLNDVNSILKNKNYSLINQISSSVDTIITALKNINEGNCTENDFTVLQINEQYSIRSLDIPLINKSIKLKKDIKGSDLNRGEIEAVTTETLDKIKLILAKIANGEASVDEYHYIGAENVDAVYLKDVNEWLKNKGFTEVVNVCREIDKIIVPLNNINNGTDSTEDYESLNLQDVTIDETNIDPIRRVICEKKTSKGSNLSISEIGEAVIEAQGIIDLFTYINEGTASVEDYEYAGISGVTEDNLDTVNMLLKGRELYSKTQVQLRVDLVLNSLKNINDNTENVVDFTNLEIVGVTDDNLDFVKEIVQESKTELGRDLTRAEVKEAVDKTLNYISILDKISNGNGTLADYESLKITGVTSENLNYITAQVKGTLYKNITELKEKIKSALENYDSYKNINDGKGTLADYRKLGIEIDETYIEGYNKYFKYHHSYTHREVELSIKVVTIKSESHSRIVRGTASREDFIIEGFDEVSEYTLTYVQRRIKEYGEDITEENIREIIKTAAKHVEIINEFIRGNVTKDSFGKLGITGVNDTNLGFVLKRLKYERFYTERELKAITEHILEEYEIYTRISNGTATLRDYTFLKVTNVTSSSFEYVNNYLKSCNIYSKEELQAKIDEVYERMENKTHLELVISRIGQGLATVADFRYINITSVTEANLSFVNENLVSENCENEEAIKAAVTKITAKYALFEAVNNGTAALDTYKGLGIDGVTSANIDFVTANIKGCKIVDVTSLQARVNSIVSIYKYYEEINLGRATIEYYIAIGITNVTYENISFVNENIKNTNIFAISSLKEKINILVAKYDSFVRINKGEASLKDYEELGILNVSNENLSYINERLHLENCFDISVIQESVSAIAKRYDCFVKIKMGSALVEDYTYLKIANVTSENIKYVNAALLNIEVFEEAKIQSVVNEVVSVYKYLAKINAGTAAIKDYTMIDVEGVVDANLNYINLDMKEKQYLSVKDIKARIDKVFSLYSVIGRINMGIATAADYSSIGITAVTASNIDYINLNIKGNSYDTESSIRLAVNSIIAQYEIDLKIKAILVKINLGEAEISDYEFLDIESVTSENIAVINLALKGKGYTDVTAVRNRVNVLVKIQNAIKRIRLGEASVSDYRILGITSVTDVLLRYVNADLKGLEFTKAEEINARIEANINIYKALYKINLGKAEISDYRTIDIISVTSNLLSYVNADLRDKNYLTAAEVKDRVTRQLLVYTALERIIKGIASINDYNIAEITGVDASILAYVNDDIAFSELRTVEQVQARINNRLEIYYSLRAINAGTAVLSHYSCLGIINVREELLYYVNADLKGKNYINVDEVKARIEQNLNVYEILLTINEGKASLDNYYEINVECVTDYNRVYINERIKGANLYTLEACIERLEYLAAHAVETAVSGRVIDATTGKGIQGVTIKFKAVSSDENGFLCKDGEEIKVVTDANGNYSLVLLEGNYKGYAEKDKYINNNFDFEASSSDTSSSNVVLAPIRTSDVYCAVLTWGTKPNDLDSHLDGKRDNGTEFNINYQSANRVFKENGEVIANLDVDDIDGEGPETITFTTDNGDYKYSIQDYTNRNNSSSKALSASSATVKLYRGSELIQVYTVPVNKAGTVWNVFEIKNGELISTNFLN